MRDLTYLFVVIGLALLNALAAGGISTAELLVVNAVIALTVCRGGGPASFDVSNRVRSYTTGSTCGYTGSKS